MDACKSNLCHYCKVTPSVLDTELGFTNGKSPIFHPSTGFPFSLNTIDDGRQRFRCDGGLFFTVLAFSLFNFQDGKEARSYVLTNVVLVYCELVVQLGRGTMFCIVKRAQARFVVTPD